MTLTGRLNHLVEWPSEMEKWIHSMYEGPSKYRVMVTPSVERTSGSSEEMVRFSRGVSGSKM